MQNLQIESSEDVRAIVSSLDCEVHTSIHSDGNNFSQSATITTAPKTTLSGRHLENMQKAGYKLILLWSIKKHAIQAIFKKEIPQNSEAETS